MSPTKNKTDFQLASIWLLLILLQLIHFGTISLDPNEDQSLSHISSNHRENNQTIATTQLLPATLAIGSSALHYINQIDQWFLNTTNIIFSRLARIFKQSLTSIIIPSYRPWFYIILLVDCRPLDTSLYSLFNNNVTEAADQFYEFASSPSSSSSLEIDGVPNQVLVTDIGATTNGTNDPPSAPPFLAVTSRPLMQPRQGRFKRQLYGFRCDNAKYIDDEGITVVDSEQPVQLTLFGERFDLQTIIGFTMDIGRLDYEGGMHDCTDNDRVASYRLNEANIVSPNMVQILARLPPTKGDDRYYFCIKQLPAAPPLSGGNHQTNYHYQKDDNDDDVLTSLSLREHTQSRDTPATNNQIDQIYPTMLEMNSTLLSSASSHLHNNNMMMEELKIWVHQGQDIWLCMKVEQPIMTVHFEILLILVLLVLSAVTSGLNLGLMSLDMNELAVISSCGSDREKSFARAIQPVRKRGNFLLCSLLLGNVMVNSSLTVILEDLSSGLVAIIGSTLAIVVLGEIVPQALCARKGLEIGARTIFLTYSFMFLTFPLSYPISCLLDWVLGEENGHVYDRERLMEFIKITGHHTQLESDEVAIISGALKLKKIKVSEIMTKIEDVFMLPLQCQLDLQTIESIIQKGYSRVPVYETHDRRKIVALVLAKDLALLDPDDKTPVETMVQYCRHPLVFVEDHVTLDVALNEFKTGKSHMAIVRQIYDDGELDKYYEAIGVVTLEDVIEEVLQVEINDETDTLSDNRKKRRRREAQVRHGDIKDLAHELNSAGSYGHGLVESRSSPYHLLAAAYHYLSRILESLLR